MTSGESRRIAFDGMILRGTVGSAMKLTFDEVRDLIDESETALVARMRRLHSPSGRTRLVSKRGSCRRTYATGAWRSSSRGRGRGAGSAAPSACLPARSP